jgi:hypothetical protein
MTKTINNPLVSALLAAGWQTCATIHHLDGVCMTPAGPGIPEPAHGCEVQVLHDRIRVFTCEFFGEAYSRCSFIDTVTVAVFDTAEAFFAWCRAEGTVSLPGTPCVG